MESIFTSWSSALQLLPATPLLYFTEGGAQSKAICGPQSNRSPAIIILFSTINVDPSGRLLPTAPFLSSGSFPTLRTSGASSDRNGSRFLLTRWAHASLTRISASTPNTYVDWLLRGSLVPTGSGIGDKQKMRKARKQFVQWAEKRENAEVAEEGLDRDSLSGREETARWRIGFAAGNIYRVERWRQMKGGRAFYNGDIAGLINQNTPDSLRANQFETLSTSDVPVRTIVGDHDLVDFGLVSWPAVADTLENVEMTTLENAGHNAWIDRPGKFNDALRRALRSSNE